MLIKIIKLILADYPVRIGIIDKEVSFLKELNSIVRLRKPQKMISLKKEYRIY